MTETRNQKAPKAEYPATVDRPLAAEPDVKAMVAPPAALRWFEPNTCHTVSAGQSRSHRMVAPAFACRWERFADRLWARPDGWPQSLIVALSWLNAGRLGCSDGRWSG
jgi:hypothetical protein